MLQGLHQFCGTKNLSGLATIEYAPTDWIDHNSFERVVSNGTWLYNILFTTGDWLKAYIIPKQKAWTEKQSRSAQGPFYQQEVNAFAPGLKPAAAHELEEMANHTFLIRTVDKSGQKWILGDLQSPFLFRADGGTDSKGHRLIFSSTTPHKAAGFDPVFNI